MSGLVSAVILAREGLSVCVLEKNRQFGGNLQIFSRDKVIFDTGVHYIGGLEAGQNLHQYFSYLKIMGKLKLKKMDEDGFDRISFDDDQNSYPHAMAHGNFIEQLGKYFPKKIKAIREYSSMLRNICDQFPLYRLDSNVYPDAAVFSLPAKSTIDSIAADQQLANVLAGNNPLYVGYPDKTPMYVHALVTNSFIESAWKCVDGGAQIAQALVAEIKRNNGEIHNYCEVDRFINKDNLIKRVVLSSGESIEGKYFISNVEPRMTLGMLDTSLLRRSYINRIMQLENTISCFTLHLVFKPNTFPYLNYNCYHYRSNNVWSTVQGKPGAWPAHYIAFVPAHSGDMNWAECMNVMVYMSAKEVESWTASFRQDPQQRASRGSSYEDFKIEKAERLIEELEKKFPTIRSCIASYYTTTPLTYRDYLGTSDGSLYGIVKRYDAPWQSMISVKTKISNLFLTGQNTNQHGILGTTIAAVKTCGELLGLDYLMKKISIV